ncbi:Flagellar P-ring protein FlgI [hydrothermal vent metagenome]|uniref:Flagellar P-ring protein FlgI n=1 Tax=hydrothermal vent metagenome TaxID=652676 RepID=A0A3B0WKP6_9ZZZZ
MPFLTRQKNLQKSLFRLTCFIFICLQLPAAYAERIKDLSSVQGMRDNQLIGYGLVVGLDGTGDKVNQVSYTEQSLKNMLSQLGIVTPLGINLKPKNVAAVMLHATLPPFIKRGQKIDVTASSVGNAKSLRGGVLLMSPLKGADGKVYALAQGNLVVGGLGVEGSDGSRITINVPSVGRIPGGAIVERSVKNSLGNNNKLILNLFTADFTTASKMVETINKEYGEGTAKALDPISIEVQAPLKATEKMAFVSMLENLTFSPGVASARVIINSRTGTVVISSTVRVSPAAVSHGNLVVTIKESKQVSQPGAFARTGNTEVVADSQIAVTSEDNRMFLFDPGVDLNDIVRAVNQVGAAPGDLVAILEALKMAGALHAELIVI